MSLGTGKAVQGEGECKAVMLELPGVKLIEDFLPLPLGNSDLILGIQWLEKLGTMSANWKTQTLRFQVGGNSITLQGDPSLGRTLISLKAMVRTLRKEKMGYLVEFNQLSGEAEVDSDSDYLQKASTFLRPLLREFAKDFCMPQGLPPIRGHEHAINFKEGSNPISVRPYRYPQVQKNKIECLVQDMLKAGNTSVDKSLFHPGSIVEEKGWVMAFLCRL